VVVVADSPVVPDTTSPSCPLSIKCVAMRAVASSSTSPSTVIAVAIAVSMRPNGAGGAEELVMVSA
jgi:hypothetical protein